MTGGVTQDRILATDDSRFLRLVSAPRPPPLPGEDVAKRLDFLDMAVALSSRILMKERHSPGRKHRPVLFEDLAIVPLLALVTLLGTSGAAVDTADRWMSIGIALAALAALVIAGRYLLNPFFRLLAASGAREVMTAAALLVVLGSALAMQMSGLSMAMGAFLAGVLLSESSFRHQLEADIEPFRGILLGLLLSLIFWAGIGLLLWAA